MSPVTLALGVLAVGALVYVVGVERSRDAAARAGSAASSGAGAATRAVSTSAAAGVAGLGVGLQFGDDLITAVLSEPGFALAAVTGIFGSLGTGGYLGDLSGLQFLLIGLVIFAVGYAAFGGED